MSVPGDRLPLPFPFPGGLPRDLGESDALERALKALDEARRERGAPPIIEPEIPGQQELPVEDTRVTGPTGSDEVFDLGPETGLELPGGGPPIPLPDPGSVKWGDFSVIYPGDGPVLIERRTRRRVGKLKPRAFEGQRAPVPPALLQLQRRPSTPSGSRARERARPRALQGFPSVLRAIGSLGASRIPLPSRSRTSGVARGQLAFRGPRPPRGLETERTPTGIPIPVPYPTTIGRPREEDAERRRARELLDKIKRGESIFPLPDVNPNIPQRRIPPSTPQPLPTSPDTSPAQSEPSQPLQVPSPSIPAPGPVTQPSPLPLPEPPSPRIPRPPLPRAPSRPRARPKPALRTAQGLGIASILRPILRRRSQTHTSLLSRFTAPFDPVTDPIRIGDSIAPPPATQTPPRIAEPDLQPLTPDNALRLSLNPQATGTRRKTKEDECNCEEEKEARRRPSSKIANVKAYRRRMSQNSLDNLRD